MPRRPLRLATLLSALVVLMALWQPSDRQASASPASGFIDRAVLSGLVKPVDVQFAPDGRVFVAQKNGIIKVFRSLGDPAPRVFADLSSEVDDYWDRGLMGLALDPAFTSGRPYVYALYTRDAPLGGSTPTWGDNCPTPPGPTTDGCVVSGRLVRIPDVAGVGGTPKVLVDGWCQQFPSHSMDDLAVGPDGDLYASAGEGASFIYADWGQTGNACADPPSAKGTSLTPPTAEGGALRAQSVRRTDGPALLNGSVIRVDPDTGAGVAGNPFATSPDANARRILAYGLRNPFRFTFRPGTRELWVGDVGAGAWEEIDRITGAGDGQPRNFGWPCYEGASRQPSFDAADLGLCESLYASGTALPPYYSYSHSSPTVPGDGCSTKAGSSVTGLAFTPGGSYPATFRGALFFADHTRRCIWAMLPGADGLPDPTKVQPIDTLVPPVQLVTGPSGDVYYPSMLDGAVHQLTWLAGSRGALAVPTATPTTGAAPLTVQLDGSTSRGTGALTYDWDLDGDGEYGDASGATVSTTFTSVGRHVVRLRVTDATGASDSALVTLSATGAGPAPVITTPTSTTSFSVGSTVSFSGSATDSQGLPLDANALTWQLVLHHCPTPSGCHTHDVQTWKGTSSGSFSAPDHAYPSYLELRLTARDPANGLTSTTSVDLSPRTVLLTIATQPTGLRVSVDGQVRTAPFQVRVVAGHVASVIAPTPQTLGGKTYDFVRWSDGGAASHALAVPVRTALTATYQGR